jgi:hypothetical protein
MTMSSFDRLNSYPISVPDRLVVRAPEEVYELRSVVAVTETEIRQGDKTTNIITGCTGLIMKHRDIFNGVYEPDHMLYDPFGASIPVRHPLSGAGDQPCNDFDGFVTNKPISHLNAVFTVDVNGIQNPSFLDRASKNGTIYIYAKKGGYNSSEIISL